MTKINAKTFDTIPAFLDYARGNDPTSEISTQQDSFCGGSFETAAYLALNGDLAGVPASDRLLEKFETLTFETTRRMWRDHVCGPIPNVPAFIAGHPLSMRRRDSDQSSAAPITIFADLFVSHNFSHNEIVQRGAAILALSRILTTARPVELYAANITQSKEVATCVAVKMDTAPLDLARAAYVLTSPLWTRRIAFWASERAGAQFPLPPLTGATIEQVAARALPWADQVVCVPGLSSGNKAAFANPQKWIIDQIRAAAPKMLDAA